METGSCVILTGPTSVGKSAVALELARLLPLRVISADSMQVYRGMDLGTAKPTALERQMAPHYCIDLVDPDVPFSVAEYLAAAIPAIQEARNAGELALVVGGTRLYLQALTGAFDQASPPDPAYRERLLARAGSSGTPALHAELAAVDPEGAARIHANDLKRIIRALEVYEATGQTISELQEASRRAAPGVNAVKIALVQDRDVLYRKVEARTAAMLQDGWLEEVARLLEAGYGPSLASTKAHGYRELAAYLQGEMSLESALEIINRNIRHFVRYQLGWIRRLPGVHLIEVDAPPEELAVRLRSVAGI